MSISFSPSQKSITECLNPEELKDQISDVLKQKKKILILGKEVVNKLDNKIKKEKLILQLRKDCKYFEEEEKNKIKNLKEITLSKEKIKSNRKRSSLPSYQFIIPIIYNITAAKIK